MACRRKSSTWARNRVRVLPAERTSDRARACCAEHGLRGAPRVSFNFLLMRTLLLVFVMLLLFGGCARDELRGSYGCLEYQLVCDGVCTDVSSDNAHCGSCDAACSGAEECRASRCRAVCEEPQTLCADGCVNTESDVDNCGACGDECAPGARCVGARMKCAKPLNVFAY